jgi:hypothetical protein
MAVSYARRRFKAAALHRGHSACDAAYAEATRRLLHPHHYDGGSAECPTYYDGCNCGFVGRVKIEGDGWSIPDDNDHPACYVYRGGAGRPWWFWKWSR